MRANTSIEASSSPLARQQRARRGAVLLDALLGRDRMFQPATQRQAGGGVQVGQQAILPAFHSLGLVPAMSAQVSRYR
jgi:hypothetical protein